MGTNLELLEEQRMKLNYSQSVPTRALNVRLPMAAVKLVIDLAVERSVSWRERKSYAEHASLSIDPILWSLGADFQDG